MRADAALSDLSGASRPAPAAPLSHVLLTGATGFFGPFLLNSLLRETPYTVHVLTRATDPVHGLDRIRASLRRSRLLTPEVEDRVERRNWSRSRAALNSTSPASVSSPRAGWGGSGARRFSP